MDNELGDFSKIHKLSDIAPTHGYVLASEYKGWNMSENPVIYNCESLLEYEYLHIMYIHTPIEYSWGSK